MLKVGVNFQELAETMNPSSLADASQKCSERKHNISTPEERIEWQTEWRSESHQLWGRQDADSSGCEGWK